MLWDFCVLSAQINQSLVVLKSSSSGIYGNKRPDDIGMERRRRKRKRKRRRRDDRVGGVITGEDDDVGRVRGRFFKCVFANQLAPLQPDQLLPPTS